MEPDSPVSTAVTNGVVAAPAVNYFDSPLAARRYAAHRPRGHAQVLAFLSQTLGGVIPVGRAADVGCGTGHSTVALLPYATSVVGIDPSSEMLKQAERHPQIEYRRGYAEALPVRAGEFDLVTVSSAYHWFDQERFLAEAARVLRPAGWLVLYKAGSVGRIADRQDFDVWRREVLKARYPKIERHGERLTRELAAACGFAELACDTAATSRRYTLDEYVDNLLTHSSVIRVVERGPEPVDTVRRWLRSELAAYFAAGSAEFTHESWIQVFRRGIVTPSSP
ncbi:class I SAM-dependent methyltransferase [Horticoccus sp. 23ND18S-11]|uniref:class I SAM-dependent methyltransferase n=1 Tax=Horticoccus sp. 23ND18S-11 TaxID=3391832 RepID=UPI0039C9DC6E